MFFIALSDLIFFVCHLKNLTNLSTVMESNAIIQGVLFESRFIQINILSKK